MNSGELNSIALAFYDIYKSNSFFNKIRESLESRKENETFTASQLIEIKQEYQKRRNQLEGFKNLILSLSSVIKAEAYTSLMNALSNQIVSLDMMISDVDNYINTNEDKYIDSVLYGFSYEKENNEILTKAMLLAESNFGMFILSKALNGEITLKQLEDLIRNFEADSSVYNNLSEIIKAVNLNSKQEKESNQSLVPTEELVNTASKNQEEAKREIPSEPTLQEKINQVQYKNNGNISVEVQTLSTENQLAQTKNKIAVLKAKGKLSLKETIQLHTLYSNEIGLQNYMNNLADSKLSSSERRRDRKIENANYKLENIDANLKISQENYKNYSSKAMRFFSARYQEQLKYNIDMLQQKNGMLAANQRASSVARFNKQSKKIARSAKVSGFFNGIGEATANKIEELKRFKEEMFGEMGNIKRDVVRYKSQRNELSTLQTLPVVMPDNIINIEDLRRMYSEERQIAA